jgi:hypothetical protein
MRSAVQVPRRQLALGRTRLFCVARPTKMARKVAVAATEISAAADSRKLLQSTLPPWFIWGGFFILCSVGKTPAASLRGFLACAGPVVKTGRTVFLS